MQHYDLAPALAIIIIKDLLLYLSFPLLIISFIIFTI